MSEGKKIEYCKCGANLEDNGRSNLGFKKYKCVECGEKYRGKLVRGYQMLYIIIVIGLISSGMKDVLNGSFPIIKGIFIMLVGMLLFQNYGFDKKGLKNYEHKSKKNIIIVLITFICFGGLMFVFQGEPIEFNKDQQKYIGNWKGDGIQLFIGEKGYIHYKKQKTNVSSSISGPIVEFNKNNFIVGIGLLKSTFIIDKAPEKNLNLWTMTVDGNKLSRYISRSELSIPKNEELHTLTNGFTNLFNNSVLKNKYHLLFDGISKTWQGQISTEELKKIFPQSQVGKMSLDGLTQLGIVYSKPVYINKNNFLILEGYYLSKPHFTFKYEFIYEYPEWKIIGFKFN